MKRIENVVGGLLACVIALAWTANLSAQTVQDGVAKVVAINGNARYMTTANPSWQTLKVGMVLKSGAIVQTASHSTVDVVMNNSQAYEAPTAPPMGDIMSYKPQAEQDALRIMEDSVLAVDKLTVTQTGADTVTETQLDLKAGRLFGTVKKLSAASKYEVKIPNGVAGIRGTIYFISADGILTVVSGSVVIAYVGPDGSVHTQTVEAGQQYDARTGQITPIPDPLERLLKLIALALRIPPTGATTFTVDHTIYHVSPTDQNGQGQNNNSQGP